MARDRTTAQDPVRAGKIRGQLYLAVTRGAPAQRIALDRPSLILGRDDAAQVQIDATGVSACHAKLLVEENGMLCVLDLASTNGTFVNDVRVETAAAGPGDRIRLGQSVELRVEVDRDHGASPGVAQLTPRQLAVARLVSEGLTNSAIAKVLDISPRTVTAHLEEAFRRTGARNRAALVRQLAEAGRLQD